MLGIIVISIVAGSAGFMFAGLFTANAYDKGWRDCWETFKQFAPEENADEMRDRNE